MTIMKAVRFEKYGPPSVLSIQELEVPDLKPGEALVELHASAINPSDVKNVAGVFKASLPRIPGRDFAGVVVAGDGWERKEVWGREAGFGISHDGTHAQYRNISSLARMGSPRSNLVDFYHNLQRLIGVDTLKLTGPAIAKIMDELRAGFEGGYLRTSQVQKWLLDQAIDAYTAVEKGTGLNKHVLLLRETEALHTVKL